MLLPLLLLLLAASSGGASRQRYAQEYGSQDEKEADFLAPEAPLNYLQRVGSKTELDGYEPIEMEVVVGKDCLEATAVRLNGAGGVLDRLVTDCRGFMQRNNKGSCNRECAYTHMDLMDQQEEDEGLFLCVLNSPKVRQELDKFKGSLCETQAKEWSRRRFGNPSTSLHPPADETYDYEGNEIDFKGLPTYADVDKQLAHPFNHEQPKIVYTPIKYRPIEERQAERHVESSSEDTAPKPVVPEHTKIKIGKIELDITNTTDLDETLRELQDAKEKIEQNVVQAMNQADASNDEEVPLPTNTNLKNIPGEVTIVDEAGDTVAKNPYDPCEPNPCDVETPYCVAALPKVYGKDDNYKCLSSPPSKDESTMTDGVESSTWNSSGIAIPDAAVQYGQPIATNDSAGNASAIAPSAPTTTSVAVPRIVAGSNEDDEPISLIERSAAPNMMSHSHPMLSPMHHITSGRLASEGIEAQGLAAEVPATVVTGEGTSNANNGTATSTNEALAATAAVTVNRNSSSSYSYKLLFDKDNLPYYDAPGNTHSIGQPYPISVAPSVTSPSSDNSELLRFKETTRTIVSHPAKRRVRRIPPPLRVDIDTGAPLYNAGHKPRQTRRKIVNSKDLSTDPFSSPVFAKHVKGSLHSTGRIAVGLKDVAAGAVSGRVTVARVQLRLEHVHTSSITQDELVRQFEDDVDRALHLRNAMSGIDVLSVTYDNDSTVATNNTASGNIQAALASTARVHHSDVTVLFRVVSIDPPAIDLVHKLMSEAKNPNSVLSKGLLTSNIQANSIVAVSSPSSYSTLALPSSAPSASPSLSTYTMTTADTIRFGERFRERLNILKSLGFHDEEKNLNDLIRFNGNVRAVVQHQQTANSWENRNN